jgi:hypothetical protein
MDASLRRDDVYWNIETEREDDGRWIAEIVDVPGVIVYGATEDEAKSTRYLYGSSQTTWRIPRTFRAQIAIDCVSA